MITTEIISLKDLINRYGTTEQFNSYEEKGRIHANTRKSIIQTAKTMNLNCTELGRGKFLIENDTNMIFSGIDFKFLSENSIAKYLSPIIIHKIIEDYNQEYVVTKFKYARNIHMINDNYPKIKKYKTASSKKYELELKIISEFYKKCDRVLLYYMESCLDRLKNINLLDYENTNFIMYRECLDYHTKSNINYKFIEKHRPATDYESRFCLDVEESVFVSDEKYKNMNKQQLYFKSDFSKKVHEELKKHTIIDDDGKEIIILSFYKGYKIFYKSIDRCKQFLKAHSNNMELNELIKNLTFELEKLLLNKTENKEEFKKMVDLTINQFKENVEIEMCPMIKTSTNEHSGETIVDIYNEYDINY